MVPDRAGVAIEALRIPASIGFFRDPTARINSLDPLKDEAAPRRVALVRTSNRLLVREASAEAIAALILAGHDVRGVTLETRRRRRVNFARFVRQVTRDVARGLGISPLTMAADLKGPVAAAHDALRRRLECGDVG